jgi:hypothetical protein
LETSPENISLSLIPMFCSVSVPSISPSLSSPQDLLDFLDLSDLSDVSESDEHVGEVELLSLGGLLPKVPGFVEPIPGGRVEWCSAPLGTPSG